MKLFVLKGVQHSGKTSAIEEKLTNYHEEDLGGILAPDIDQTRYVMSLRTNDHKLLQASKVCTVQFIIFIHTYNAYVPAYCKNVKQFCTY